MTRDLPALFPIREEGVLRIFIALKNPTPWPGFEPATFGSSSQHTNHYTTEAKKQSCQIQKYKVLQEDIISLLTKTNCAVFNCKTSRIRWEQHVACMVNESYIQ
jgi:hypothetical protein